MKNLLLTVCAMLLAVSIIQAQETEKKQGDNQKQEKLHFMVKGIGTIDDAKPDIYVDGKKFDFPLELLDQSKIESISIIKDEQAKNEYNAPNGVVLIETKKETESNSTVKIRATGSRFSDKPPMMIIDGEVVSDKEILAKLTADDVESIEIFKDGQAVEKYNAPNGVVIITTKKGKKRKK